MISNQTYSTCADHRCHIPVITALAAAFAIILNTITPSFGMDPRTYASLRRLDPDLRLEQICDLAAMEHITREMRHFRPDRAKSYVTSAPDHLGDMLQARGAAFRSGGDWYGLSFICKASSDHLKVLAFDYKVGKLIPESDWPTYGLWR
jgi:hypothetical protein